MKPLSLNFTWRVPIIAVMAVTISVWLLMAAGRISPDLSFLPDFPLIDSSRPVKAAPAVSPFIFSFNGVGILQEKADSVQSGNPYWWLDSGAKLIFAGGFGTTIQGALSPYERWRLEYYRSNSLDTDNGYHPQNIFRLVSRQKWLDYSQSLYFQILRDNLSSSPNRNESNGVLLFNRYQDGENLYYAGVRVDGTAVIKKKYRGEYYTLAQSDLWAKSQTYDAATNPDILPKGNWIGIESRVKNLPNGRVAIELLVDQKGDGTWKTVLSVTDDGRRFGPAITAPGFTGIRTDFMDVRFWQYKIIQS